MTTITLVTKAYRCAAAWHSEQRRKGAAAEPYINHLAEVADLVSEATAGSDINLIAAAVLHDVIEDAGITHEQLAAEFNRDVADLVLEVSDDRSLPKAERKRLQIEMAPRKSPRARLLKIADKTSNLRAILTSPPADWSDERKLDYLAWARAVVAGARGQSNALERAFDDAADALEEALAPSARWTVYVDDNFHYMDEDERFVLGTFEEYEDAVAACQKVVDDFLAHTAAETADALYERYVLFGEDPWIKGPMPDAAAFSARRYARQRCDELRRRGPGESNLPA